MKRSLSILLLGLLMSGCGSGVSLHKQHETHFLDDKVLQERVQAALGRSGSGFQQITVNVNGSSVTLGGSVASPQLRSRAEDISRAVYGVKDVQDQVEVKP